MPPQELVILGGGSWGTALAVVLAPRFERVRLWVHNAALAGEMEALRENRVYLPGFRLPGNVEVTAELCGGAWVLCVVPSAHLRGVMQEAALRLPRGARVISATKGIEAGTDLRMSEVIAECGLGRLGGEPAVLSGPTFAREVAQGEPAAVVVSSSDGDFCRDLQAAFNGGNLRCYTNRDVVGVELCGALKNIIAIAAGAVEGLGLGTNSLAALITRGLAEMGRLVVAMGGQPATLAGLAGLGDLVLTCTGGLSRNRRVGLELAQGRSLEEILASTRMVAEGVETTRVALDLAMQHGVEMPIAQAVAGMLAGRPALVVLRELVERAARSED